MARNYEEWLAEQEAIIERQRVIDEYNTREPDADYFKSLELPENLTEKWESLFSAEGFTDWLGQSDIFTSTDQSITWSDALQPGDTTWTPDRNATNQYGQTREEYQQTLLRKKLSLAFYGKEADDATANKLFEGIDLLPIQNYAREVYRYENYQEALENPEIKTGLNSWLPQLGKAFISAAIGTVLGAAFGVTGSWADFLMKMGTSAGGIDQENLDGEPGDAEIPTGWGEDYATGPDYYFDPETGKIGQQDPVFGGIPEPTPMPDYTREDPVKGISDYGDTELEEFDEYGGTGSTGSFEEYEYSQFQEAGDIQSQLGSFDSIASVKDQAPEDLGSEALLISDWVENMPNMPKAASFLYPQS